MGGSTVLVAAVGFHPTSVLVAARSFGVSRVVLVCTPESEATALVLEAQLGVPCVRVVWEGGFVKAIARTLLKDVAPGPEERVVLDITGSTKPLAIGAWEALRPLGDGLQAVYLAGSGALVDAWDGRVVGGEVVIPPAEVLAWHGAAPAGRWWSGRLDELPSEHAQRFALGEALAAALAAGRDPEAVLGPDDDPAWFGSGLWLESWCLVLAARAVGSDPLVRAVAGAKVKTADGANDELDVVLTRGARLVVIEAKGRRSPEGAGPDLQKRVAKSRRLFGEPAQVVFVHPAWGARPPVSLADLSGRGVTLIGHEPERLVSVLRRALGTS